jgi:opacity protein-like surface antigen
LISRFIVAGSAFFAVAGAHAHEGFYGGLQVSRFQVEAIDEFLGKFEANPATIELKLGVLFNRNFAVEAVVGAGLTDDSFDRELDNLDVKPRSSLGLYAKGMIPLSESASIYGLAGLTGLGYRLESGSFSSPRAAMVPTYGIGTEFSVSDAAAVHLEWLRFNDSGNFLKQAVRLGGSLRF